MMKHLAYHRSVRKGQRGGLTITELLVAATLLITIISVFGSLTVRWRRLHQQSRHYQIAVNELSDQLDRLLVQDVASREAAIASLAPSEWVAEILPAPRLAGQVVDDADGPRIVLSLSWTRPGDPPPLTLVGWLATAPQLANDYPGDGE